MRSQTEHNASLIQEQTSLVGQISTTRSIRIEGTLHGSIITEAKLVVGKSGLLKGKATGKTIDVSGIIEGDIIAKKLLVLREGSMITGTVYAQNLRVESGAIINSEFKMTNREVKMPHKELPTEKEDIKKLDYIKDSFVELMKSMI